MTLPKKKIVLSTLLFIIVFSGLGLFYGHWGLSTDDWGNLHHTMMAQSWKDFGNDPEWQKARTESEVNGKLTEKVESVFLSATDYSPLK